MPYIPTTVISSGGGTAAFVGAKVYSDATQNINNTVAAVTFNLEEFDSDGFHDTGSNTSRLTVPTGLAGKYLIQGGTFGSAGADYIGFRLNGTTAMRGYQTALTTAAFYRSATTVAALAEGDYIEMLVATTNNINVGHATLPDAQSWFTIALLGI